MFKYSFATILVLLLLPAQQAFAVAKVAVAHGR